MIIVYVAGAVIICCICLLVRNKRVLTFRLRMLHEEEKYLTARRGFFDGFKRYESLVSYYRMLWEIWKPLSSYERPLSDYYSE